MQIRVKKFENQASECLLLDGNTFLLCKKNHSYFCVPKRETLDEKQRAV